MIADIVDGDLVGEDLQRTFHGLIRNGKSLAPYRDCLGSEPQGSGAIIRAEAVSIGAT
jgi:hypothetical protein